MQSVVRLIAMHKLMDTVTVVRLTAHAQVNGCSQL